MGNEEMKVGSVWKARDGRMMRVESVGASYIDGFLKQRTPVTCRVLNARPFMRPVTTLDISNFGNFLTQANPNPTVEEGRS